MDKLAESLKGMSVDFLSRGGNMGAEIRAFDWAGSGLGSLAQWSASLRGALAQCLSCPLPAAVVWGPELTFLHNDAWTPLDGVKPLGLTVAEAWPTVWKRLEPLLTQAMHQGVGATLPDCSPPSGTHRAFDLTVSPLFDDQGAIHGGLLTAVDASKRVLQLEDALKVSEARYRTLFNNIDEGVCVGEMVRDSEGKAVDYRFVEINPLFSPMTGLPQEAVGKTARELVPELEQRWVDTYARAALGGEAFRFQDVSKSMGRSFDVFVTPVEPHGCFALVFNDVTERKRREATLRFLVDLNVATQPLSEPREIMAVTVRMLGEHLDADRCAYAEVESDEDHFFVPHDYTRGVASMVGRFAMSDFGSEVLKMMRSGHSFVVDDVDSEPRLMGENLAAYRNGELRSVVCTPLRKAGRFVACLAVHHKRQRRWLPDEVELIEMVVARCWESIERARTVHSLNVEVHEVKVAQEALREADRRKDEFLAMLAHELRNPLAPIRAAVPLLLAGGQATPRAAQIIERQVTNMAKLLDDLLDVSRITRGLARLEKERLDLSTVALHAAETTRSFIESRGHRLTLSLSSGVFVEGDRLRLEQVVINLLNNAGKYMDEGGAVRLVVSAEGEEAALRVEDEGVGISAELLPHVFELFTQGDRTIDRSQGGLGIGLTMVKSLVELQGGTVRAASAGPGQGSQFLLTLPLLTTSAPEPGTATTTGGPVQGEDRMRVLVVDDNRDSADMMAELLDFWGYEARVAHDGATALREVAEFRPAAMLLDIGMPGMDGYEVARRLRLEAANRDIFLVALTGYGSDDDRRKALNTGFNEHMTKPVDPADVQSLLESLGSAS